MWISLTGRWAIRSNLLPTLLSTFLWAGLVTLAGCGRPAPPPGAEEALRAWDEHDGRIDLLLTDMVMPEGMTGSEVAAQLRRRKPGLKVIFTSGYSPEIIGKDFSQGDATFLCKPYLPPQLAQTVRQCLDNGAHRPQALVPA